MSSDSAQPQKEVEFYAAVVAAWLNTSLEHDKSVFTLSAGGIGLLITLLTTVGVSNVVLLVLYILAILLFLVSLIAVLAIFRRNRTHIEQVFLNNQKSDPVLFALDKISVGAFGVGAVLTAVIGISTAVSSYSVKEKLMAGENKSSRSNDLLSKSFNGVGGLQQQSTAAPTAAPATPPTPAPAPASAVVSNPATNSSSK